MHHGESYVGQFGADAGQVSFLGGQSGFFGETDLFYQKTNNGNASAGNATWYVPTHLNKDQGGSNVTNLFFSTLNAVQSGRDFAEDMFKCISWGWGMFFFILIQISLNLVLEISIDNTAVLFQVMAWR